MPKPAPTFRHRNLPNLLLEAREAVLARFRPILNAHGVTEQQWRIVRALHEQGDMEPREIVEKCGISSPSLTGVLVRMEEVGLVTRERLDHDQRRLKISLTAKSRALAVRMAPLIEAAYAELEARIGSEFIGQLYDTLDRLIGELRVGGEAPVSED